MEWTETAFSLHRARPSHSPWTRRVLLLLLDRLDQVDLQACVKLVYWWNQQLHATNLEEFPIFLFRLIWIRCDHEFLCGLFLNMDACRTYTHKQWHPLQSNLLRHHDFICTLLRAPYSQEFHLYLLHSVGSKLLQCRDQWFLNSRFRRTQDFQVLCLCARCSFCANTPDRAACKR